MDRATSITEFSWASVPGPIGATRTAGEPTASSIPAEEGTTTDTGLIVHIHEPATTGIMVAPTGTTAILVADTPSTARHILAVAMNTTIMDGAILTTMTEATVATKPAEEGS